MTSTISFCAFTLLAEHAWAGRLGLGGLGLRLAGVALPGLDLGFCYCSAAVLLAAAASPAGAVT